MDIAKAFDTLSWIFLFSCLESLGLPPHFVKLLKACICKTSFMVGYNGTVNGYFKGSRGLRQGDPLSPYLFVISMNCLSFMLNSAAAQEKIKYHSNCKSMKMTHLSFADDLLIFIDGSLHSVQQVLQVLKEFEKRSGLAISMQKTSFYASGMTDQEVDTIQASTGMICGTLPVRYLGVPLNSRKLNLVTCEPLIHQIKKKFSSWSVKSLSFAGRLLIIKTVIAGITTFWCSAFILPKACIARINSLCSVFLWRGDIDSHNTARVAWETVVLTTQQGGLGVKDLHTWNKACCLKLVWLLFFRSRSMRVAWFREVVLKGSIHNYWTTKPKVSFSWLANKILKLKDVVYPLVKLRLENGLSARFWHDNWSPLGNVATLLNAQSSRLGIPQQATVASLFRNGSWRLPPARSEQQLQLQTHLTTVNLTTEPDYFEWEIEGRISSKFSTGEVYHYLRGAHDEVNWATAVWTSYGIPRHNFHTWLVVLDRCPTRDRLLRWGLQVPPVCLLCNSFPETRNHLYFECEFAYNLWLKSSRRCSLTPSHNWPDALNQMITLPASRASKALRLLTLLAWQSTIYWTWNERNARLHSNSFRSADRLFRVVDLQIRNRIQSFRESNPRLSSSMMQTWFRLA